MRRKYRRYSEAEIETMISAYESGLTIAAAAATCGAPEDTLYVWLVKRKIARRDRNDRSYRATIDETRFASIDTPEDAYWLGWMFTDGYVTDANRIGLELAVCDIGHLSKFAAYLRSEGPPREYGNRWRGGKRARFAVRSQAVFNSLSRAGCNLQKTWTVKPWEGATELMRSFWLGCFEGDGCIHIGAKLAVVNFVGNEAMVRGFSQHVKNVVGRPGCLQSRPAEGKESSVAGERTWTVAWHGRVLCRAIVSHLYAGACVWLDRKKSLADRLISYAAPACYACRYQMG